MFGPGPLHAKTLERGADGFAADALLHQLILITDCGRQAQGPQTRGPPKVPRTLGQDLFQLFHTCCGKAAWVVCGRREPSCKIAMPV